MKSKSLTDPNHIMILFIIVVVVLTLLLSYFFFTFYSYRSSNAQALDYLSRFAQNSDVSYVAFSLCSLLCGTRSYFMSQAQVCVYCVSEVQRSSAGYTQAHLPGSGVLDKLSGHVKPGKPMSM